MPKYTVNEYSFPKKVEVERWSPDPTNSKVAWMGLKIHKDQYDKYFVLKPKEDGSGTMVRIECPPNLIRDILMTAEDRIPESQRLKE